MKTLNSLGFRGLFLIVLISTLALNASANHVICPYEEGESAYPVTNPALLAPLEEVIETPPFAVACQDPPTLMRNRPPTPFYKLSVPEQNSIGLKSRDFLLKIAARVREKVDKNKQDLKNLYHCMRMLTAECKEIQKWENDLFEKAKDARYQLSMAQGPHQILTWVGITDTRPNAALNNLGTPKGPHWDALTDSERELAEKMLTQYITKLKKLKGLSQEKRDAILLQVRYSHFKDYNRLLTENPLLFYLHSANPNENELADARDEAEKNQIAEEKNLEKIEAALAHPSTPLDPVVLQLMNYSGIVETELLQDHRYCGLGASLLYTLQNRDRIKSYAVYGPVLLATALFPVAGVAAGTLLSIGGVASGVMATGLAQSQLNAEVSRNYSAVAEETSPFDTNKIPSLQTGRNISVATIPLGALGSRAGVRLLLGGIVGNEAAQSVINAGADALDKSLTDKIKAEKPQGPASAPSK